MSLLSACFDHPSFPNLCLPFSSVLSLSEFLLRIHTKASEKEHNSKSEESTYGLSTLIHGGFVSDDKAQGVAGNKTPFDGTGDVGPVSHPLLLASTSSEGPYPFLLF